MPPDKARIDRAMVLAAGLGTRMRPITNTIPKPLVSVGGRALIDYAFAALIDAGVRLAVVNIHHLPAPMLAHLGDVAGIEIIVSDETDRLLDSGGGVVKALPELGLEPFFVLNADTFWVEPDAESETNLMRLANAFDPARMDLLMLVAEPGQATGHEGAGDFTMDETGRLARFDGKARDDGKAGHPLIYAGAFIVHPRVFAEAPDGAFSLNRIFDKAIAGGRLFGITMRGHWLTVGTPEAIGAAEAELARIAAASAKPPGASGA